MGDNSGQTCGDRSVMVPMDRVPVAGGGGISDQIGPGRGDPAGARAAVVVRRRLAPSVTPPGSPMADTRKSDVASATGPTSSTTSTSKLTNSTPPLSRTRLTVPVTSISDSMPMRRCQVKVCSPWITDRSASWRRRSEATTKSSVAMKPGGAASSQRSASSPVTRTKSLTFSTQTRKIWGPMGRSTRSEGFKGFTVTPALGPTDRYGRRRDRVGRA